MDGLAHTRPHAAQASGAMIQVNESEANLGVAKSYNNNNNVEILSCARAELPLSFIKYLQRI